jgi:hypothetical protein
MFAVDWTQIVAQANLILSSATVILSFALLVYVLGHNLLSNVGRSFAALLACLTVVYACDVAIGRATLAVAAEPWLRVQWLGIAFLPAAYLHFSHALLSSTNVRSRALEGGVIGSYVLACLLVALALFTDLLVTAGTNAPPIAHLVPGLLFPVFVLFFAVTATWGLANVYRARKRCLTPAARRRMNYLSIAFIAPAIGAFPFLILVSIPHLVTPAIVLVLAALGNLLVGFMLIVLTYTVAYYGVLTPDRAVRQSLVYYLLRGPVVGTLVVVLILTIPDTPQVLGLPRDVVLIGAIVATIILMQVVIHLARPVIDRVIYWHDRDEVAWLAEIDRHLMTSTDLRQVLENILVALCEALRTPAGFVAVPAGSDEEVQVEAVVGPREAALDFVHSLEFRSALDSSGPHVPANGNGHAAPLPEYSQVGNTWLFPLRARSDAALLGWVGLATERDTGDADGQAVARHRATVLALLRQASKALEDRQVQQDVFGAVRRILPEMERMQALRSVVQYPGSDPLPQLNPDSLLDQPDFERWVRDALNHYWGGPKLTNSPLLRLHVVADTLAENDNNPARALRSVLKRAIELQRPDGDRKLTATEWLLYNILDMKFVQGERVRDIAARLAMSESDLYRKQRVAITEVAKTLADMELKEKL